MSHKYRNLQHRAWRRCTSWVRCWSGKYRYRRLSTRLNQSDSVLHKKKEKLRTFNAENDGHVDLGLSVNLALVNAGVSWLDVVDAKVPVIGRLGMQHTEPRVASVRKYVRGEDVQVAFPHPGYLWTNIDVL